LAASGVWVEPASAAGLAGLANQLRSGQLDVRGLKVVAVCTGHGLKDPDIIASSMARPQVLAADLKVLEAVLIP